MKIDSSLAAVVTGGASGLGLATVKALRAAGVQVAIFDLNEDSGEQAAAETGSLFCQCDVLSDESVDAAFFFSTTSSRSLSTSFFARKGRARRWNTRAALSCSFAAASTRKAAFAA